MKQKTEKKSAGKTVWEKGGRTPEYEGKERKKHKKHKRTKGSGWMKRERRDAYQ